MNKHQFRQYPSSILHLLFYLFVHNNGCNIKKNTNEWSYKKYSEDPGQNYARNNNLIKTSVSHDP